MMIDQLESLEINGVRQWVLYRGADQANPVVLFVHGGPGYPLMWFSRAFDDTLVKDFVVVHWDQRNSGKSYSPDTPTETFTLAQIADDGLQVTERLKRRFGTNKIILVGHSWGTMVAAHMANESPDDFLAYISTSTCADWKRADELRYELLGRLAHERSDRQATQDLERLGPPPYVSSETFAIFGEIIVRLTGFSGTSRRFTEDELAQAIQKSSEYTEAELETTIEALHKALNQLGGFCNTYVLRAAVPRLDVPVFFVQGKYDLNTPTVLAKEYFDVLDAPQGKHWIPFEESAHLPMYEEPQKFLDVLKSTLAN